MHSTLTKLLPVLLLLGCTATGDSGADDDPRPWDGTVHAHGALRAMFHEGQTGTTATLDTLLP